MQKLNGESMDIVSENISKLRALFPDVFSEGKIDFEVNTNGFGYFKTTQH